MERVRPLTAARAVGLASLLAVGCASHATRAVTASVSHAVKSVESLAQVAAPAAPATQMTCVWQRQLAFLPDPTRDGALSPGLVGQMFLIAADDSPAEVAGDVTVAVYDETPRPDGTAARPHEVYHFTRDVVKRMATNDERFGRSYVLFLPWSPSWHDVTAVRILARYDAGDALTLHTNPVQITLDRSSPGSPVWQPVGATGTAPTLTDRRAVPNGAKVAEQVRAASANAPAQPRPPSGPVVVPATGP